MISKSMSLFIMLSILVLCGQSNASAADTKSTFSEFVDDNGLISLPKDFRNTMSHLGSWFVPEGDASGFHDVYSQQADVTAYRETGKFPDGAILIKELRASSTANYTTGKNVSFSNKAIKQWFIMIKDTQNRFPNNKNWGSGWGWALFKPDNPEVNVSKDFQKDCKGCHIPAKETDWVYIEAKVSPFLSKLYIFPLSNHTQ